MAERFEINLLKIIAAEIYFLASMNASREMYGKGYFSLGIGEKTVVDQAVWQNIGANFQGITPDLLEKPPSEKVGFQPPEEKKET